MSARLSANLSWLGILRLGLVQAALGAAVVLVTATLNRIMTIELALPATVPGALVAWHYAVQVLRPRLGFGADQGGRCTPWIIGGVATLAAGAFGAALATVLFPFAPVAAAILAVLCFTAVGLGVGAAGTSLLALVAACTSAERRGAAASLVWTMMIAGIVASAAATSHWLQPFTPARLLLVAGGLGAAALATTLAALWRLEPSGARARTRAMAGPREAFGPALRGIWAERQVRDFAVFVFLAMLAYSAQELLIEPFGGAVFGLTPAQTAGLTGLQHAGVLAGMLLVGLGTLRTGAYHGRVMRAWTVGGCLASAAGTAALACCAFGPVAALRPVLFLLGMATGTFSVAAIGAMMGLASQGRAARNGTRIGLWGAAQALAFGAGGLMGTSLSDLLRTVLGRPETAYATVFLIQAGLFAAAAVLAARSCGVAPARSISAATVAAAG